MKSSVYFKKILLLSFIHFVLSLSLSFAQTDKNAKAAESLEWHTDLMKAYDVSKKTKKPIFAMFTGSDWCVWCRKLQADVFAKKDFIDWAKKNVVLLEVDFPRAKQLPPETVQQNQSLQQTFGINGYPTVWLFNLNKSDTANNFNIDPIGSTGYPAGAEPGKEEVKFLNEVNTLIKNKTGK
ncbi:MAG: thioredoxin family protein [Sphingobacteriaceae bacterium]|jgi:thioredoxin-related protein